MKRQLADCAVPHARIPPYSLQRDAQQKCRNHEYILAVPPQQSCSFLAHLTGRRAFSSNLRSNGIITKIREYHDAEPQLTFCRCDRCARLHQNVEEGTANEPHVSTAAFPGCFHRSSRWERKAESETEQVGTGTPTAGETGTRDAGFLREQLAARRTNKWGSRDCSVRAGHASSCWEP